MRKIEGYGGRNMAESIIAFVIFLFVAVTMIMIGVSQIKSKEPVGFYTCEKLPKKEQLLDAVTWNKKHGYMLIIYGLVIIGSFTICSFIKIDTIAWIIHICVIFGALPIMMLYHSYLKKKYYK